MKKLFIFLIVLFWSAGAWAYEIESEKSGLDIILEKLEALADKPEADKKCPIPEGNTTIDCFKCHIPGNFEIKEVDPDSRYTYPHPNMKRVGDALYFYLTDIPDNQLKDAIDYAERNGIKKLIIEIQSGGGPVYAAIRDKNLIERYKANGGAVETHINGIAASAGFMLFLTGDTRLVAEHCNIMWHEVQSYKIFWGAAIEVSSPSDKEEEARILRFMNDNIQSYIASRCKLSKEQLDDMVRKKELWINHEKALEYGFATGILK